MAWRVALPCQRLWKQKQDDMIQTSFKLVTQPVTQPFLRDSSVVLDWIVTGALLMQVKQPGVLFFSGWEASLSQRLPPPLPQNSVRLPKHHALIHLHSRVVTSSHLLSQDYIDQYDTPDLRLETSISPFSQERYERKTLF